MTRGNKTHRRALVARVEMLEGRVVLSPGGIVYNPNPPITTGPKNFVLLPTTNAGFTLSKTVTYNPPYSGPTGPNHFTLLSINNPQPLLSKIPGH